MHVLWINDDATMAGGCERYILQTVLALRSRGVRSSLLYQPGERTSTSYLQAFDGAFPNVDTAEQLRRIRPDLAYVHQLESPIALQEIQRSRIPSVRFFHDHRLFCLRDYKYTTLGHHTCTRTVGLGCYPCLGFVRKSPGWPGVRLARAGALLARQRANHFFNAFVLGSGYMAEHVAAHGFDRSRIHVIPPFTDLPDSASATRQDPNAVLFVGQLIRGKGLDLVLQATARARSPIRLEIAGEGRQRAMYENLASSLGLGPRVRFLGKLAGQALEDRYRSAAMLVFPSRSPETFGLVGIEAMSRCTPVIATRVGGVGEWLDDGRNGIAIPPGDVSALAAAMDRLAMDPGLAARMGDEGRRTVESRFLEHHHVESLLSLFRRLTPAREAA